MDTFATAETVSPARRRARKQLKKRMLWGAIVVALLAGMVAWAKMRSGPADNGLKDLQTAAVERTTLVETVSATGSVTAQTGAQVKIGSQITGRIKRLFADVGSHVKAGQVIAELDLPDIVAQQGQAQASLVAAEEKLKQQESGVGMQRTQTGDAVRTAQDALSAAQARSSSAAAASSMQPSQTRSDIQRAQAGLATAKATETQVETSHDLQIQTARAAVQQAEANSKNAAMSLKRNEQLFKQGYVPASDVDTAQAQADVSASQVDSANQSLSLSQAKADADVQTAKQQVAQAQSTLSAAKSETFQNVMKQQDVRNAEAAVRQARSQLSSARAGMTQNVLKLQDVEQARAAVQQAREQVKYQQAQVAKTVIKSPISGTVLQMAAQQGETLAAGLSAPTLIVVADLHRLQVDAFVDETDIGKVKLGQKAAVTVDAYPNRKFSGKVIKIASGSTVQQNVITYDVSIAIQDPLHLLKPDMTASVTFNVGEHPEVLGVPNEAVKPDKSGSIAWVLHKGAKTPVMESIQTGATDGTNTEIVSGLKEGDTVVLAGWPPPQGFGGLRMTPFGLRPADQPRPGAGGKKGGGRSGGGGGRRGG